MDSIKKLEKTIEEWLKPLPHLPSSWRNWIGQNVWWMALIGVILSAFAVLAGLGAILTAMSLLGVATSIYGVYMAESYSSWWMISSAVALVFMAIILVLTAMAIQPLKGLKKKGWDLLFLTSVIGFVSMVISAVMNLNALNMIPNLLSTAISAVISMYFLFEIRSHFVK